MEEINKTISLERYKSRVPSLVPYIGYRKSPDDVVLNNGNWGKYPYDIDGDKTGIDYFKGRIWPFSELSDLYSEFIKMMNEAVYYRRILKNGDNIWSPYIPTWNERIGICVMKDIPSDYKGDRIGVWKKESYDMGGYDAFSFLCYIMGMFNVPDEYINDLNTVPEYMYYSGIDSYINSMKKYRYSKDCCHIDKYMMMGGDKFLSYLEGKINEAYGIMIDIEGMLVPRIFNPDEIDEYNDPKVDKFKSPCISIPVLLTDKYGNNGIYTVCDEYDENPDNEYDVKYVLRYKGASKLKSLKPKKVNFDDKEPGKVIEGISIVSLGYGYGICPVYQENKPVNLESSIDSYGNEVYYGDMIYKISYDVEYEYDDEYSGKISIRESLGIDGSYSPDGPTLDEVILSKVGNSYSIMNETEFFENTKGGVGAPYVPEKKNIVIYMNPVDTDIKDADGTVIGRNREYDIMTKSFRTSGGDVNIKYVMHGKLEYSDGSYYFDDRYSVDYGDYPNLDENWLEMYGVKCDDGIYRPIKSASEGIRYEETRKWSLKDFYGLYTVSIGDEENIFKSMGTNNLRGCPIIDDNDEIESNIMAIKDNYDSDITYYPVIMEEHNFGKSYVEIGGDEDISIDRGYANAFELHSKLGEINTFEDMQNYQNNFFKMR